MSLTYPVTVSCLVDWNEDDDFTDANEDISSRVVAWEVTGSGRNKASDLVSSSRMSIVFSNTDGFFSPYNVSGPLYNLLPYGKEIVFSLVRNGTTYPVFRGHISEFFIDGPTARFDCVDPAQELRKPKIRLPLQVNKRVDEIINAILDEAGWPVGRRNLDVATYTVPWFWPSWDAAAWDAVLLAAKQEIGGAVYFDKSGDVRFESTKYRMGRTSLFTVSGRDVGIYYRSEDVAGSAEFRWGRIAVAPIKTVIYTQGGAAPVVPGHGSATITGSFGGYGAYNVDTPIVDTDIHANSAQDGSGIDKTAQISVTSFTAYGSGFKLVVANADSAPVYLVGSPGLQIQGYAVRNGTDDRTIEVAGAGSSTNILRDTFDFTNDTAAVTGFAQFQLAVSTALLPRVEATLLGNDDTGMLNMLTLGFSELVTVNDAGLYRSGLTGDFVVEGWVMGGKDKDSIYTRLALKPKLQALGGIFRISPNKGGVVYSPILAGGSPVGGADRIGW